MSKETLKERIIKEMVFENGIIWEIINEIKKKDYLCPKYHGTELVEKIRQRLRKIIKSYCDVCEFKNCPEMYMPHTSNGHITCFLKGE